MICITGMRVYGAEEGIDKIEIHMPLVETQRVRYYSFKKQKRKERIIVIAEEQIEFYHLDIERKEELNNIKITQLHMNCKSQD